MTTLMRTLWTYPKKAWHWLTSMRTALVLLFVLAIAAIPGTILPQRSLNQGNVADYIANNGRLAEIYDQLQLFDVFESTWFNSIFMLLTISLVGCILPRSWDHYQAMKTDPGTEKPGPVAITCHRHDRQADIRGHRTCSPTTEEMEGRRVSAEPGPGRGVFPRRGAWLYPGAG